MKHALAKAFPAAVYNGRELKAATPSLREESLVLVAEPVDWVSEFRCFVLERELVTWAAYRHLGRIIGGHDDRLDVAPAMLREARHFAESVLQCPEVETPPAFVLDIGLIEHRGWAIVEANECWASGIYACDPERVLRTLLRACVPTRTMSPAESRWDFELAYRKACP